MNHTSIHAVLTGDIVNSTQLDLVTEQKLLAALREILQPYKSEFFRGDSFQVYMKDPAKSLEVALRCRTAAIAIRANDAGAARADVASAGVTNEAAAKAAGANADAANTGEASAGIASESSPLSDIRISIGIGSVTTPVGVPGSAKGTAFLLSGRSFDEMQKAGARLAITTEHELGNTGLAVIADYINAIYEGMTVKQAEVIGALLKGETQQQVANDLGKSKSTISQMVHSARWAEIEKLLGQYETLLNQLLNQLV